MGKPTKSARDQIIIALTVCTVYNPDFLMRFFLRINASNVRVAIFCPNHLKLKEHPLIFLSRKRVLFRIIILPLKKSTWQWIGPLRVGNIISGMGNLHLELSIRLNGGFHFTRTLIPHFAVFPPCSHHALQVGRVSCQCWGCPLLYSASLSFST